MSVVVTGGAGFVGSHLADRLVKRGERVIVCDDLSTGRLANLHTGLRTGQMTFVYCDVSAPLHETRALIRGASNEPVTAIYHLASSAHPDAYGSRPWETLVVNGAGTLSMIELALEEEARLLFASTGEVDGDSPVGPRTCYDEGKRYGEAAMSIAVRERGLQGSIARLGNCYGPRMDLEDGRVVPACIAAARERRPFPLHDAAMQTRSLTFVDDVIDGLLLVAGDDESDGQPVHLGSEDDVTLLDFAHALAGIAGVPFVAGDEPALTDEARLRKPDLSRARALGWSPRVGLMDGLRRTYDWAVTDSMEYV